MRAIRFDEKRYEIGEVLPASRVWIDGEPTEDLLDGTSCLTAAEYKHIGREYSEIYPLRYVVEGRWVGDGYDNGEVILDDCEVVAVIEEGEEIASLDEY